MIMELLWAVSIKNLSISESTVGVGCGWREEAHTIPVVLTWFASQPTTVFNLQEAEQVIMVVNTKVR